MRLVFPSYAQSQGLPCYWRAEASGRLAAAVMAYLDHQPTPAQLALVIAYCAYWIEAPCWQEAPFASGLATLRQDLRHVVTAAGLQRWLEAALELGIDPL
jgi:hypothetical protein